MRACVDACQSRSRQPSRAPPGYSCSVTSLGSARARPHQPRPPCTVWRDALATLFRLSCTVLASTTPAPHAAQGPAQLVAPALPASHLLHPSSPMAHLRQPPGHTAQCLSSHRHPLLAIPPLACMRKIGGSGARRVMGGSGERPTTSHSASPLVPRRPPHPATQSEEPPSPSPSSLAAAPSAPSASPPPSAPPLASSRASKRCTTSHALLSFAHVVSMAATSTR